MKNMSKVQDHTNNEKNIFTDLDCILVKMCIPQHLLGYKYFRFMVEQSIQNPALTKTSKEAYSLCATHFNTSLTACENAIKRALSNFWYSNNLDNLTAFLRHHYSVNCGIPSDFDVIVFLALYLRAKHNYS